VEFCPKCKGIMLPKALGKNKGIVLVCRRCKHQKKTVKREEYKIVVTSYEKPKEVAIIEKGEKVDRGEERKYLQELYGGGESSEYEED
jgi:DNA-directed RNA polymerase subunit M/transcription elongation factor TFIIS